jgi:hypothetical protein
MTFYLQTWQMLIAIPILEVVEGFERIKTVIEQTIGKHSLLLNEVAHERTKDN